MLRVSKVIDGEPKPFEVTQASWSRVEKAYKREIPPTVRGEITHAISVYLFKLKSAASPSVTHAEKRIESDLLATSQTFEGLHSAHNRRIGTRRDVGWIAI